MNGGGWGSERGTGYQQENYTPESQSSQMHPHAQMPSVCLLLKMPPAPYFPFQPLLNCIFWTLAEAQTSITLTMDYSSTEGSRGASFISPEALDCWRLPTGGWAGQAARAATVHAPWGCGCNRSTSGVQGKGCLQDSEFQLPSYHKRNALRTSPTAFSFYRIFYNIPKPVLHHFIVLWFWLLTKEGLSNFFPDASRKEWLYTYFSSPIPGPELNTTLLLPPGTFDSHKPEAQILC